MEDEQQEQAQQIVARPFVTITFQGEGEYKIDSNVASCLWKGIVLECAAELKKQL